jgi:hypothetical protein
VAASVGIAVRHALRAADYPGARLVTNHNLYRPGQLAIRRDTTYRTQDTLPQVYHWYSSGFELGPESSAHSSCITMERSTTWLVVEQHIGVMVCDTPTGRLVFVERSAGLRLRR